MLIFSILQKINFVKKFAKNGQNSPFIEKSGDFIERI
jgi:hypothetical protein